MYNTKALLRFDSHNEDGYLWDFLLGGVYQWYSGYLSLIGSIDI